ncbi:UDP-N-acetylmuramoyl-tripeptide--D-alanyl-D-alanine ligase [Candidatus Woesebacteria bacterium]|nr:UDP-N-acetylmuramoyl-tripeptide--D-alanyl-D-alanine ligase [Candidatus Woesebacteria bacterium]
MSTYQPTGIKKLFHRLRRAAAGKWLSFLHVNQIAITGSQGKTHATYILYELLKQLGNTLRTDINLDTLYNVPITAMKVLPWTKFVIWELGIDKIGEMNVHLEIVKPEVSIMTGISSVHTDEQHLKSLANVIKEKRRIIEVLPKKGHAILNFDDQNVRAMRSHTLAQVLSYGTDKKYDFSFDKKSIKLTIEGTTGTMNLKGTTITISTPLLGAYHFYNLLAGYAAFSLFIRKKNGIWLFQEVVKDLKPLRGRMSIEKGPMNTILLNDSLRANPASTEAGLETLDKIDYKKGRKIAVIGEMGELANAKKDHAETGNVIARLTLDYLVCIGPLRKNTIERLWAMGYPKENIFYASDVFQAADILKNLLKPGDLWYLKGSLLRNYKRIVHLLNGEEVCCREVVCPYNHCGYDKAIK